MMDPIFSFCSPLPYDNANSKDLHLHSLKVKEKSKLKRQSLLNFW